MLHPSDTIAVSMKAAGHNLQDIIEAYIGKLEMKHSGYFQSPSPDTHLSDDVDCDDEEDSDYESEHASVDEELSEYLSDDDDNQSVLSSSFLENKPTNSKSVRL